MRGELYDWESRSATRLTGQNVRGLTSLKLEKVLQFMKKRKVLITCLMETWRVTPDGFEAEELDGFLIVHHGEKEKTCRRGRNGVAIVLSPEARMAWEAGGSKINHSSNGRLMTMMLAVEGGLTLKVGSGYAPCSGRSSDERQAFYDDVSTQTSNGNSRDILVLFIDANASPGVGVRACDRPPGSPRSLGPWGNRNVNAAGQEFREFMQLNGLASAATFFRSKGDNHDTWIHPRTRKGSQIDHALIKIDQIGRVANACVKPSIAVNSDHFPLYVELWTGRMKRRQVTSRQMKPANLGALRNPDIRLAYGNAIGTAMSAWVEAHPEATLEERAGAWREIPQAVALEVCGKRERREEGWFAAEREALMELVVKRNDAEVTWRKRPGQQEAHRRLNLARKELKRKVHNAKVAHIADQVAKAEGGQKSFWEAVRAINGGDSRAAAVAVQKFLDEDGSLCETSEKNAETAAKHFTKVYNNTRERPPGSEEAIDSVSQRAIRVELDAPISKQELRTVLQKAKPGKATSNQVPVEMLDACRQSDTAFNLLHSLVSDIFEDGRAEPNTPPEPPLPEPPPEPPPPEPPPDSLSTSRGSTGAPSPAGLIAGAKNFGWRCKWQQENPKRRGSQSEARYASYYVATTHAEALELGARPEDLAWDLGKGYLQIFPDSLLAAPNARAEGETTEVHGVEATSEPISALLKEFARMRLKLLPKKGDLRDLNNWRGIMLLDAASKIISMIINDRLQRLLKEVGIEEQNGFSGGRGCSDGSFCIRQALKKRREHGLESWVLFVDLVKAFDSVPRDVLFTVLAKFGVPPHLIRVIKRMNADLEVAFDLGGEPVAVPCSVGVKQGCPLSPTLFLFVMQACLESLERTMPEEAKLQFRTNTRMEGKNGGKISGTDWTNQGEFKFSFWASIYADDAAIPLASRAALLAAANSFYKHLRLFGMLMHVGSEGKRSKTEAMYCPARNEEYSDGDTSDLVLDCGGTVSFTESFVYLGSLLHRDLSDHHDVEARIKKASKAFGALRDRLFSSADVPERLKGKVYAGGVLAVLLYGCESWCLTAASIKRLSLWHNKRIREMCRVTMCQTFVHRITSKSLQQRTGVFDLPHYIASRTLLWAGHVARMPKSRLPKRLLLSWVRTPRVTGGQEMTYGRSLERHLLRFDLPTNFTEWANLAQDRNSWHKLATKPPFAIGKPFVRRPRGDTRVTPEDKRRHMAQRAAEIAERRAAFHASTDQQQP